MEELDIPILQRTSSDTKRDSGNYGSELLQICKNHMICICNGRCSRDIYLGKQTAVDGSVIDCVIGSPYLLSRAKEFDICDFDPLFSDKHCIISLELYGLNNNFYTRFPHILKFVVILFHCLQ